MTTIDRTSATFDPTLVLALYLSSIMLRFLTWWRRFSMAPWARARACTAEGTFAGT